MRPSKPALIRCIVLAASTSLAGCATIARTSECAANPAQALLVEINQARSREGVAPLWPNAMLISSAQGHAQALADGTASGHFGADGSDPLQRITEAGYEPLAFGENTATGSSTPARIVEAWLASPGHRMVLLDAEYEEIGLGAVLDVDRPVWVANFGARAEPSDVRCHPWQQ